MSKILIAYYSREGNNYMSGGIDKPAGGLFVTRKPRAWREVEKSLSEAAGNQDMPEANDAATMQELSANNS